MRIQSLIRFGFLVVLFAASTQAQENASPFNVDIGGGIGVPLSRTSDFAGVSGAFQVGAGPNITSHQSIVGEFLWQGLPPNRTALQALSSLTCVVPTTAAAATCGLNTSRNLYALTANYMYHREGRRYGFYLIGGGGWYYRYGQLKNAVVAPGTVCQPVWDWWGYSCVNGFVSTNNTLVSKGVSSGGVNAGGGLTINLSEQRIKFFIEARYHYSPQGGKVSTQVVPVIMGIRY
jgi:hypothetical protein